MASEKEVVAWGDGEGVAHECGRVDCEGTGHLARDTVEKGVFVSGMNWLVHQAEI
jgi:hypothetical protein